MDHVIMFTSPTTPSSALITTNSLHISVWSSSDDSLGGRKISASSQSLNSPKEQTEAKKQIVHDHRKCGSFFRRRPNNMFVCKLCKSKMITAVINTWNIGIDWNTWDHLHCTTPVTESIHVANQF